MGNRGTRTRTSGSVLGLLNRVLSVTFTRRWMAHFDADDDKEITRDEFVKAFRV